MVLEPIDILGVRISAVTLTSASEAIEGWVKARQKAYVCVAPVSTLVDCQRDPAYRKIVNEADMVTPDGMPVVWLAKVQAGKAIDRTYGPDLMRSLCGKGHLRHYFFGSTTETLRQLEQALKKEFPEIRIAGTMSPPFRPDAQIEEKAVLEAINQANPDILWVGLGAPKQDFWMKLNRARLEVPVMIGVGAAFDFLAGVKPQAPKWIQRSGFEWLFRLCCEPKRLWKRYLIGNSLFVFYVIKDMFKKPSYL
jgi:N-acetylglucosaminyldiphosphoundecaprenol N-acetyl-beta-D-mannosaminyltransferase